MEGGGCAATMWGTGIVSGVGEEGLHLEVFGAAAAAAV